MDGDAVPLPVEHRRRPVPDLRRVWPSSSIAFAARHLTRDLHPPARPVRVPPRRSTSATNKRPPVARTRRTCPSGTSSAWSSTHLPAQPSVTSRYASSAPPPPGPPADAAHRSATASRCSSCSRRAGPRRSSSAPQACRSSARRRTASACSSSAASSRRTEVGRGAYHLVLLHESLFARITTFSLVRSAPAVARAGPYASTIM
jgi:hypothetical protein